MCGKGRFIAITTHTQSINDIKGGGLYSLSLYVGRGDRNKNLHSFVYVWKWEIYCKHQLIPHVIGQALINTCVGRGAREPALCKGSCVWEREMSLHSLKRRVYMWEGKTEWCLW